jgi:ATP-binding cassette subfamily B multidrug efflux pump
VSMEMHRHDEIELGKVFDFRLIRRLYGFMKPYMRYILLSMIFLVGAIGVELSFPYISKVAIDDFIVKTGRKVRTAETGRYRRLDESTVFMVQRDLEKIDPKRMHEWEIGQKVSKEKYYYLDKPLTAQAREVVARHPSLFEDHPAVVLAPYDRLKELTARETAALRGRDFNGLYRIAFIFLLIILSGAVVNFLQIYLSQYAGQLFMHAVRTKVFKKLEDMDMRFFDRNPVGRLVTRATNDVEAINEAFTQVFSSLVRDLLLLAGIVGILIAVNIRLALVAFTVIPLVVVLTSYFRIKAREIYRAVRIKLAKLNATLQEYLSGIRVIKIFNQEFSSERRFDATNAEYLRENIREVTLLSFFRPLIEVVSSLGIALVLYFGGGHVIADRVSLGVLVAFIAYVEMFFRPIRELTESYTMLQSAMASSERIFILLDEEIRIRSAPGAIRHPKARGDIEFDRVWFRYNDDGKEWVLRDVTFRIRSGEHVAFVGATGAGKTSIISLLSRLYEIQRGTIRVDGIDIRSMELSSLRSHVGVVMQDVFLFAGNIKSNIRLNLALSDERVKEIASYINADRFIERLPRRYDENVMERGATLSMGERQLLSFARVLAFDPRVIVLDEATANIDAETEKLVQNGLAKLMEGRTSIIIAHRLSTIKDADRIYVLHRGEIKETGTHDELLRKRGIYHSLYELQALGQ